jgi:2'-5' RNA ligase
MNYRDYLELETTLTRRLVKAWRENADPVYAEIAKAVQDGHFQIAKDLVPSLDMFPVGEQNREWIRAMLASIATWGASNVVADPHFSLQGKNGQVLDNVVDLTLAYLKGNATAQVRDQALQSIAAAEGKVAKKIDFSLPEEMADIEPNGKSDDFKAIEKHMVFLADQALNTYQFEAEKFYTATKNDKWRVTSALQKAIRRGDLAEARKMAVKAVELDSYYAWRRMTTIAVEDVSFGNCPVVAMVLATSSNMEIRKKHGDGKVAAFVAEQLAGSVKDRMGCDVACLGIYGATLPFLGLVESLEKASKEDLAEEARAEGPVLNRASALKVLYDRCKVDKDWTLYAEMVRSFELPPLMSYMALKSSYKAIDSLAATLPLAAKIARDSTQFKIRRNELPATEHVGDYQSVAFDQYTQTGRSSLAYFSKASAGARHFFSENEVTNKCDALGTVLFNTEGSLLDRELVFDLTDVIREKVVKIEYVKVGLPLAKGQELAAVLKSDCEMLQKARTRVFEREQAEYLEKHPETAQLELSFKAEYQYGSTQINIHPESEMAQEMERLKGLIADEDLAGKGKETENHVTIRYGLVSGKDGVHEYLKKQGPFDMVLGGITVFPESEHSDGACPVVLDINAPDLERMNAELAKAGKFKEADFEYHPHATLAYVKPEVADKYRLMGVNGRKYYPISAVISNTEGEQEEVPLCGAAKADDSYIKPLVSFGEDGDDQLQMISSLNSSRMASWGFIAEADARNVREYTWTEQDDSRTCEFCRMMLNEAPTFQVEDARSLVNRALACTDPNDLATIQPWPDQSDDAMAEYDGLEDEALADKLADQGFQVGPYHPGCRGHMAMVAEEAEEAEQNPDMQVLPEYTATPDTFDEMGMDVSGEEADKWNSAIGLNPMDVLSTLAGKDASEMLEDKLSSLISFEKNGDVAVSTELADDAGNVGFSMDPITDRMYVDNIDLAEQVAGEEGATLEDVLGSMIDIGTSAGAGSLTMEISEASATALGKMGFTPSPLKWQTIRMDAQDKLNGPLRDAVKELSPDEQTTIFSLLASNDESSFSTLCQLPIEVYGKPLAEQLFGDLTGPLSLDLSDEDAVAQAKEYLGGE